MNSDLSKAFGSFSVRIAFVILASCWSSFIWADTPAGVLDRLATPAGASVQMVTSNSVHNGVPVAIATLHSSKSKDSIFSFYRDAWASGKDDVQPGFVEFALPGWQLISRLHDGFNIVVQLDVAEQRGTSGFISVMVIDRPVMAVNHGDFSDLISLSSHRSVDGVDTSFMRVYASSLSMSHTHNIYRHRLISKGWQVLSDTDVDDGWVMVLVRDQARLEVSIVASRDYGSVLVAHQVTSE